VQLRFPFVLWAEAVELAKEKPWLSCFTQADQRRRPAVSSAAAIGAGAAELTDGLMKQFQETVPVRSEESVESRALRVDRFLRPGHQAKVHADRASLHSGRPHRGSEADDHSHPPRCQAVVPAPRRGGRAIRPASGGGTATNSWSTSQSEDGPIAALSLATAHDSGAADAACKRLEFGCSGWSAEKRPRRADPVLSESAGLGKGVAPAAAIDNGEEGQSRELALEILTIDIRNILLRRGPGPGAAIYNMVGALGRLYEQALSRRAATNK